MADSPAAPTPRRSRARRAPDATPPPVALFLPGIRKSPRNSAARVAELIAIKASKGPGTYVAQELSSFSKQLSEGRRIVNVDGVPVLDVYTVDYHPALDLPDVAGTGVAPTVRRFGLALAHLLGAVLMLLSAGKRAKSTVAKFQLVLGLGAVFLLMLSAVFTGLAILVALGVWTEPDVPDTAADAIAVGGTALTTWLFFSVRPAVARGAKLLEQVLAYAQDERHAAGVTGLVDSALDDLLEKNPGRKVYLVGYSIGALIAMDFAFPRRSLAQPLDARHRDAIASLVTIGCPLDFVRLYFPTYADDRLERVPGLPWTNIYIPADILASNMVDGDDYAYAPAEDNSDVVTVAGVRPVCHRYTSQTLTYRNVWTRTGLLTHAGYWDEPERENCLHLVMRQICPETLADAAAAPATGGWPR
ncbi:hypothetical protein Ais01nite_04220 [Asanoa ishikariensis]|uniref:Uncharacterized protein n=1 Tax=Asanoa ishikariensis TaxID=137265 RepID=A0A1H3TI01_9ACTN|nr:hypothetical protein [Asanoa ishikariensis]GIF62387.1 hypothetical protein Ais01nite_04220 [Asanoa ishikariensis]SDZ49903.1 hypothetical protein SAMN05421684_5809 [Asanoa ishikariensis]